MAEAGSRAAWGEPVWAAHLAYTAGASEYNSKNKCIFPDGDKYKFTDTTQC